MRRKQERHQEMGEEGDCSPFVIPFFIAQQGCPHQCLFCNQRAISGAAGPGPDGATVAATIRNTLARPRDRRRPVQVAFYGGSFTGLVRSRQEELLGAVRPFLEGGEVVTIRISTRPDYLNPEIASFLKKQDVGLVELGIQSFDQRVLDLCRRGHQVEQVEEAFAHLRGAGIGVGGQLMVGLPGERFREVLAGARRLAGLAPELVRIYPALVLAGSPLADLYREARFRPLTLAGAVALCAKMAAIFAEAAIPVARIGLQPGPSLEGDLLAGPYHPAFGELVQARLYFKRLRSLLAGLQKERGAATIRVILAARDRSLLSGRQGYYYQRLSCLGLLGGVELAYVAGLPRLTIVPQIDPV